MEDTSNQLIRESRSLFREFIFAGITLFSLAGFAILILFLLALFLSYFV